MKWPTQIADNQRQLFKQTAHRIWRKDHHELRMTGRGCYYSYSFDLGPELDIFAVAHRLLRDDLATVAASPVTSELRVGKRVLKAEQDHRHAEKFERFLTEMYSDSPSFKQMARVSKGLSLSIGYALARAAIKSYLRSSKSTIEEHEDRIHEIKDSVKDSEQKLRNALMSFHIDGAIRVRIEQKEHYPRYFETEPYLRLEMRPALYRDEFAGRSMFQISLMLHRSGICILTLATDPGAEMNSVEMGAVLAASTRKLEYIKLPRQVVDKTVESAKLSNFVPSRNRRQLFDNDFFELTTAEMAEFDESLSVTTVFETYLRALEVVSGRTQQSEWHCYTTLTLGKPACTCRPEDCKDFHKTEFARLVMRAKPTTFLTQNTERTLLENHLQTSDREMWIAPGSAVYVSWTSDSPDLTEDLHQLIPLESAVLQVRQLEQIDSMTSAAAVRDKNLFSAQNLLSSGLQEYRRNLLVGPDSAAIIDAVSSKLGADTLYDRLMDRVKILESMVTTRYSRMQSRRSISISIAGFLAVLLFLLPRITESIRTFSEQGEWPAKTTMFADDLIGGRGAVVLWIYLFAIIAFIITFISVSIRPRIRPLRSRKFGYRTKRNVEVVLVDTQDDVHTTSIKPWNQDMH